MNRAQNPPRAPAAQRPGSAAGRKPAPRTLQRIRGGALFVVLTGLFWLIFYQNLPPGLNVSGPPPQAAAPDTPNLPPAGSGGDGDSGSGVDRLIKLGMLAVSVGFIGSRWSLTRNILKNSNPGLLGFMVLIPASMVWSIEPAVTLLRFVTLACIFLLAFSISLAGWDRERLVKVALPPAICILVLSLILGLAYPDRIIELGDDLSQKDAWHGITNTKNQFGMMASIAAVLCFSQWLAGAKRSWLWIGCGAISFACLLLSRSNTSMFATLLSFLFLFLVMRVPIVRQKFSPHVAIGIAGTIVLYQLVIQGAIPGMNLLLSPVASLTGKDMSFSARTVIWDIIKEHSSAHPFLGTGYAAYWTGPTPNSPSFIFTYVMYFYPTESHNGYLEILNDLGVVGLGCLAVFLVYFLRQAFELMRYDRAQAALYLALLFQQMVMNMSESEWFARTSTFAVLILASTCLSRALFECRRQGLPRTRI